MQHDDSTGEDVSLCSCCWNYRSTQSVSTVLQNDAFQTILDYRQQYCVEACGSKSKN